jgi:hypothetical protein
MRDEVASREGAGCETTRGHQRGWRRRFELGGGLFALLPCRASGQAGIKPDSESRHRSVPVAEVVTCARGPDARAAGPKTRG